MSESDEQAARECDARKWLAENWCKPPGLYPGIYDDAKKCAAYAASRPETTALVRAARLALSILDEFSPIRTALAEALEPFKEVR